MTCKTYSRAFLHNLVAKGLPFASHLVTYHNVAYTQVLDALHPWCVGKSPVALLRMLSSSASTILSAGKHFLENPQKALCAYRA